ncbi:unnamed protein product [Linum tenue]|uniref:Alanyl-transfer RNA synthetases family profile domain-containing protein n=1 Tax=Linum tenue TaxID=586396 RepID=A0AAV0K284_9ROSI|nr:unnamed protein product [Linum tenue]
MYTSVLPSLVSWNSSSCVFIVVVIHPQGIERFKKDAKEVEDAQGKVQKAFVLWDTYGFPLDLTQLMAEERKLGVDVEGFNKAMDEARERSRSAQTKQAGGAIVMDADATSILHKKGVSATDDSYKYIWFQIKAIYTGSEFLESVTLGNEVIFDTGLLEGSFGSFEVRNVQIFGGFILHIGSLTGGTGKFSVGEKVVCKVDYERRKIIAPNHTCTHMLNFALREVSLADAKQINGLRAVFGEVRNALICHSGC